MGFGYAIGAMEQGFKIKRLGWENCSMQIKNNKIIANAPCGAWEMKELKTEDILASDWVVVEENADGMLEST